MRGEDATTLATGWLAAIGAGVVRGELEGVYARIGGEVAARRPVCDASGRCCKFEEWGHRLYVTGLEAAYTVARLGEVGGAGVGADGEAGSARTVSLEQLGRSKVRLDEASLERARAAGGCPFQIGKLCGVHTIRPLGCRVYYCDPTAQAWQQELSEVMLAEVRAIHERHAVAYRYGEWRAMLGMLLDAPGEAVSATRSFS